MSDQKYSPKYSVCSPCHFKGGMKSFSLSDDDGQESG